MTKLPRNDMSIAFSNWLTNQMREKGLSQSELARAAGLTRQAISYYLSAKSKQPDAFALQKIAKGLGLPAEEVFRAAGVLPPKPTKNELIERIINLVADLPAEEKQDVIDYAELVLQRMEKRRKKK